MITIDELKFKLNGFEPAVKDLAKRLPLKAAKSAWLNWKIK